MSNKLQEGDVIKLGDGHSVYAQIPKHFVYANHKGDFSMTRHKVDLGGQFEYLSGKYVVYKTANDGGSTGHDPYPNGHHVWCEKTDNPSVKVDFYQSGCFTAMIPEIEVIAKAEMKWIHS